MTTQTEPGLDAAMLAAALADARDTVFHWLDTEDEAIEALDAIVAVAAAAVGLAEDDCLGVRMETWAPDLYDCAYCNAPPQWYSLAFLHANECPVRALRLALAALAGTGAA